jgi:SAM-dependent methyltransferase
MSQPENLSDKIRKRVREIEKKNPSEILSFLGPEPDQRQKLNPDTDEAAFSVSRKKYEDLLLDINKQYVTDMDLQDNTILEAALSDVNNLASTRDQQVTGKGVKGLIRRSFNRLFRFGLAQEFAQQDRFNAAVTHAMNELAGQIRLFAGRQRDLNAKIALFGQSIVPVMDEKVRFAYDTLNSVITENIKLLVNRMDILHQGLDRRQTEVLTWLQNAQPQMDGVLAGFRALEKETMRSLTLQHRKIASMTMGSNTEMKIRPTSESGLEGYDYYVFEKKGRGAEVSIQEQQRSYVDLFQGVSPVLDIGCGRGEFLELLKDTDIPSQGVDSNGDMVGICQEKGLDVVEDDALHFLSLCQSNQWGGIFCAQVIEHYSRRVLREWLTEAYRTLKPGGILCVETINTSSPYALVQHYQRDPTHQLPLHPETYQFLMELHGFTNVTLDYISPVLSEDIAEPEMDLERFHPEAAEIVQSILYKLTELRRFVYAPCDIVINAQKPESDDL